VSSSDSPEVDGSVGVNILEIVSASATLNYGHTWGEKPHGHTWGEKPHPRHRCQHQRAGRLFR